MIMNRNQKQKSMCKICGKSFPSGNSLGGHMRGHLVKKLNKTPKLLSKKLAFADADDDDNDDSYVLSQYKKSSSKVSFDENNTAVKSVKKPKVYRSNLAFPDEDDASRNGYAVNEYKKRCLKVSANGDYTDMYEKVLNCKECGKEFPSVRSLCGHMRWHTVKKTSQKKDFVCQICGKDFDTRRALFGHMTRHSRKTRALNEPEYSSQSDSEGIISTSYDTDSEEIKQAAIILMMLSQGLTQKVLSDLVLEKSEGTRFVHKVETVERKKHKMSRRKKLGIWGSGSSLVYEKQKTECDDLDEMDVFDDKVVQDDDAEDEFTGFEIENRKRKRVQPGENFKVKKLECQKSCVQIKSQGLKKSKRHSCRICSKAFPTRKGLGSHKKVHKYEAFVKKEDNVHLEMKPWCVGNGRNHEAMLKSSYVS